MKETSKVTFLGPFGSTFSHDAYNILAEKYNTPEVSTENYVVAGTNSEILRLVIGHGGYGAIAMETLAEGRVAEPLESFIDLLNSYRNTEDCPIKIIGAIRLRINFCLMVRPNVFEEDITGIIAHPKALGACKKNLKSKGISAVTNASSNGEAARLVSCDQLYSNHAALGPRSAAEKYGLKIINDNFEDSVAITTFFLIAPCSERPVIGKNNRALIVFKTYHNPGALVRSLLPFAKNDLNLIQIYSVHAGNGTYNFVIEVNIGDHEIDSFRSALDEFRTQVESYLCFGPFEVPTK